MKRAGYDAEALAHVERAMGATLSPERQAAIQREQELVEREKLRKERQELLDLADAALDGKHGPEAQQLALDILDGSNGGRSDFNLSSLRTALRRLR
jgi:hypothetical protein